MKIRQGFVSNSSSSSFCIKLDDLTADQIDHIKDHVKFAKQRGKEGDPNFQGPMYDDSPGWDIFEHKNCLCGGTVMTNFEMDSFFYGIGVPEKLIVWDDFYWDKESFIQSFKKKS